MQTRQIVLASRPAALPEESNFRLERAEMRQPADGQFIVRNEFMSVDPYMRSRMNDRKSYIPPFQVGQPLDGNAVGQVIESRHRLFPEGTWVSSFQGWREYFLSNGEGVNRIDTTLAPPSAWLGVLGIPGFTGWYGLKEIGKPRAGETLVVSGAAGATGSLVGQVGKILGCRVIGIAGSDEKCALLTKEYGFDTAINYRNAGDIHAALARACPNGIEVYFENVGGAILDAVLRLINPFARIVMCGMISQYNLANPEPGPRYLFSVIPNRALMQGFIISDHFDRMPEFIREVGAWVKEGRLKYRETIVDGLENAPRAFIGLLTGQNTGKMVVRIGPGAGRA